MSDRLVVSAAALAVGRIDQWITSPARRCRQTLAALLESASVRVDVAEDARLWEQDFGDWDGLAQSVVPDIGKLNAAALAVQRPPNGESFADVCRRVQPALSDVVRDHLGLRVAIVAHAGVVRAGIALALAGSTAAEPDPEMLGRALSFEVRPLSLTKLRVFAPDAISIACCNWCAECP